MKKLIMFLVRRRLGLKKYEIFTFTNQKSTTARYFFTDEAIIKCWTNSIKAEKSHVSLNYILSDECEIRKVE